MKKIIIAALALFVAVKAEAQPVSVYQPPTPVARLVKTPGAIGSTASGIATDEFLRQQMIISGATVALPTPAPLEITPQAQATILPAALPTLFPVTPNALVNTTPLKALRINNEYDIDVLCTYGAPAATPRPFTVPAGSQHYENFAANGAQLSTGVSCIHPAATPAAGTLQVWGY